MVKKDDKKDKDDGVKNFLIGLLGGAFIYAILASLAKPICPNPKCRQKINRGITECPYCKVKLEWK